MTKKLRQVTEQVEQLDPAMQEIVAERFQQVLEEIAAEQRWDELFSDPRSQDVFAQLRAEALADIAAGDTEDGGFAL